MLCLFGRTWIGFEAIAFILRGNAATSDYLAAPELSVENREPAGSKRGRSRKKHIRAPKAILMGAMTVSEHIFMLYDFLV